MSPCMIRKFEAGTLTPVDYSADNLAEAVQYEPQDGVYTVTNTFDVDKVLKLDAHLDRLEDSARRAEIPLQLNRPLLRAALRQMITEADFGSVRFRITVPRESATLILSMEPFSGVPPELIENGTRCITAPGVFRHNAAAKTTDWMHARKKLQEAMPQGIYDTILCDADGNMLEGLGSNFYAILADELRTAGEGVLKGIAQQIVFEVAPGIIPVQLTPANRVEIPQLSEAFITSSSRGIIPIVEIDGQRLSDGCPGPKTRALRAGYQQWLVNHLEPL